MGWISVYGPGFDGLFGPHQYMSQSGFSRDESDCYLIITRLTGFSLPLPFDEVAHVPIQRRSARASSHFHLRENAVRVDGDERLDRSSDAISLQLRRIVRRMLLLKLLASQSYSPELRGGRRVWRRRFGDDRRRRGNEPGVRGQGDITFDWDREINVLGLGHEDRGDHRHLGRLVDGLVGWLFRFIGRRWLLISGRHHNDGDWIRQRLNLPDDKHGVTQAHRCDDQEKQANGASPG